ncbi:MAG: sigma-70 family RNA polymerase sigma factor [Myxococcales bacterium]|nr:sigma-70 family RNA polymerase sigma factor [Myxococcales bacterium]
MQATPADSAQQIAAGAMSAHPTLSESAESYATYLLSLDSEEAPLEEIRGADLYVAWCCSRGCGAALEHFWTACVPTARRAALSVTKDEDLAEDVVQEVLKKLIVGTADKTGTLASYRGRSKLERWLRSVTVRAAISASRKNSQMGVSEDEDAALQVPAVDDDPELALLKESSGAMVETALRDSLRELDSETRLVLQQHLIDGLTIDQLASVYRIHRVTAARRIAKAREALLSATRHKLRRAVQLTGGHLDSLINFAQSRVKLSLRWFAATQNPE